MSTNIIKMYRGDNYEFDLTIDDSGDESGVYRLNGDDAVYFALMEPNASFENPLIAIKIQAPTEEHPTPRIVPEGYGQMDDEGNITFILPTGATSFLVPGVYYYSVKLEQNHPNEYDANKSVNKVITIINKTKFIILD